jgi:hypothetical protein
MESFKAIKSEALQELLSLQQERDTTVRSLTALRLELEQSENVNLSLKRDIVALESSLQKSSENNNELQELLRQSKLDNVAAVKNSEQQLIQEVDGYKEQLQRSRQTEIELRRELDQARSDLERHQTQAATSCQAVKDLADQDLRNLEERHAKETLELTSSLTRSREEIAALQKEAAAYQEAPLKIAASEKEVQSLRQQIQQLLASSASSVSMFLLICLNTCPSVFLLVLIQ